MSSSLTSSVVAAQAGGPGFGDGGVPPRDYVGEIHVAHAAVGDVETYAGGSSLKAALRPMILKGKSTRPPLSWTIRMVRWMRRL